MPESFRTSLVNAWVSTRMERDKSLLSVSAAAIGLLVALLKAFDDPSWIQVIGYTVAFSAFVTAIVTAIQVFDRNSHYLRELLSNPNADDNDPVLDRLDKRLKVSFYIGLGAFVFIGALALASPFVNSDQPAPNDEPTEEARISEDAVLPRQHQEPEQPRDATPEQEAVGQQLPIDQPGERE